MGDQRANGFGYQPALDGLRALAVVAVVGFHLGVPWLHGGYLGVSVFFTLSGYLITSLLLDERARTGRIDVPGFYLRRARRLLPASMLCLTAIAALSAVGAFGARPSLRAEVLAALTQVANWRALLAGESYADLFATPSPVDHFWSLAIEEQFYLLWPIVLSGAFVALGRGRRSITAPLAGAFVVVAASAPVTAQWWGADAAYLASWSRFAEILAGAVLAAVIAGRPVPTRTRHLAAPALVTVVLACAWTPAGRGWPYAGGLPAFALVSAALVAGLQHDGPVRRALSWRPAVWLGRVSYGVYLVHWPVIVVLDPVRTGLDGVALGALRVAVTLVLATASFRLVERPIRTGVVLRRPPSVAVGATAAFAVVLGAIAVVVPAGPHRGADDLEPVTIAAVQAVAPAVVTTGPRTIALFGDSVPDWLVRDGTVGFTRTDVVVIDAAHEGCDASIARPLWRDRDGNGREIPAFCQPWSVSYRPVTENLDAAVDTAVLVLGQAVVVDRLLGDRWVGPCEDMGWYRDDIAKRITFLQARVDEVVLALPAWGGRLATWFVPADHLTREACVRDQLAATAQRLGAGVVDLADVLCPDGPDGPCAPLRERDGLHIDPEDAPAVLDWLLDAVVAGQSRDSRASVDRQDSDPEARPVR